MTARTKPDWKDAPEWAEYLAMDEDGAWYWYEARPYHNGEDDEVEWKAWDGTDMQKAMARDTRSWRLTLETRPND